MGARHHVQQPYVVVLHHATGSPIPAVNYQDPDTCRQLASRFQRLVNDLTHHELALDPKVSQVSSTSPIRMPKGPLLTCYPPHQ